MHQCAALRRYQTLAEQFALALETFFQRQGKGRLNSRDAALGREQTRGFLLDFGALGGNQGGIVDAIELVGALAGAACTLAIGNQFLGEGDASSGQVAVNQFINHAQFQGFAGADRVAADNHVQGFLDTDQAWQTLSTTGTRQQAELHFRQANLGAFQRDAVMAADRHFQTATQCGAMDHGDAGLAARLDAADHFGQAWRFWRLAEFLDVGAGDKGRTLADQHDGLDLRIGFGCLEAVLKAFTHGNAQRVDGWIIDSDDRNGALSFQCDHVRHA